MKVIEASGDTPMAVAARIHEGLDRGIRQCCEEHRRADHELAVHHIAAITFPAPGECRAPGDTDERRHERILSRLMEGSKEKRITRCHVCGGTARCGIRMAT